VVWAILGFFFVILALIVRLIIGKKQKAQGFVQPGA